eukprot:superscaffoldBa00002631_g14846
MGGMEAENGGTGFQEWDDRLLESSPEVSKHPVEDVNHLEKSHFRVGHCVDTCGVSQLIRSAASGREGFHVDVVVKEFRHTHKEKERGPLELGRE